MDNVQRLLPACIRPLDLDAQQHARKMLFTKNGDDDELLNAMTARFEIEEEVDLCDLLGEDHCEPTVVLPVSSLPAPVSSSLSRMPTDEQQDHIAQLERELDAAKAAAAVACTSSSRSSSSTLSAVDKPRQPAAPATYHISSGGAGTPASSVSDGVKMPTRRVSYIRELRASRSQRYRVPRWWWW